MLRVFLQSLDQWMDKQCNKAEERKKTKMHQPAGGGDESISDDQYEQEEYQYSLLSQQAVNLSARLSGSLHAHSRLVMQAGAVVGTGTSPKNGTGYTFELTPDSLWCLLPYIIDTRTKMAADGSLSHRNKSTNAIEAASNITIVKVSVAEFTYLLRNCTRKTDAEVTEEIRMRAKAAAKRRKQDEKNRRQNRATKSHSNKKLEEDSSLETSPTLVNVDDCFKSVKVTLANALTSLARSTHGKQEQLVVIIDPEEVRDRLGSIRATAKGNSVGHTDSTTAGKKLSKAAQRREKQKKKQQMNNKRKAGDLEGITGTESRNSNCDSRSVGSSGVTEQPAKWPSLALLLRPTTASAQHPSNLSVLSASPHQFVELLACPSRVASYLAALDELGLSKGS
jgi:hypothetical protein